MAGEISVAVTLTAELIGDLYEAGLKLGVMVDCSHAINVRTERSDRPGQPIITKAIELDCALSLTGVVPVAGVITYLQAAAAGTPLAQIYAALQTLGRPGDEQVGVSVITQRNIKIEFTNFDDTIFDPDTAFGNIGDAVTACRAADVATFNRLQDHVRRAMGMYRRENAFSFVLKGMREPGPRVAVA